MADVDPITDAEHLRAGEARRRYAPAEARALGTLAALAALTLLWVVVPLGTGVLLGTVLAFTAHGVYRPLAERARRSALAAAGVTALTTLVVAGALGVLAYLLVMQGVAVFSRLPGALAAGGPAGALLRRMAAPLRLFHVEPSSIADRLTGALASAAASAAAWATHVAGMVFDGLLALFFMAATMFFVLRSWTALGRTAERLMPINPRHTRRLMREARRLGHAVVVGNFGTAVVQGTIAGAGYFAGRVPEAALLGAVTAIASLVPVFGTMLVWVPAGLVLAAVGRVAAGVFVLLWGSIAVVGFCDYVVRPKLVRGGEAMPAWTMLVALFGGIKLFGFMGVLLGPMVVGLSLEALRLYGRTRAFRLGLR